MGACELIESSLRFVVSGTDVRRPDNDLSEVEIGRFTIASGEMMTWEQCKTPEFSILGTVSSDFVAPCCSILRPRCPSQHSRHAQR
jgi:hypothetical protein